MADLINVGTAPYGQDGDNLRTASIKLNARLAAVAVPSTATGWEAVEGVLSGKYIQQTPAIQQITAATAYTCGRTVVIQGSGFLSCVSVTFGGVQAKWKCAGSDSILWCQAPPTLTAGAVNVVVTCATNPGQAAVPATLAAGFTYAKRTNGGTPTKYFQSANPGFYNIDSGSSTAITAEDTYGLLYFTSGLGPFFPSLTGAVSQIQVFTPGSTALAVVANQQPYQFADGRYHGCRGLGMGGCGHVWGNDHHANFYRISLLDPSSYAPATPGQANFNIGRYELNHTGDASFNLAGTPGLFTGPDGWLYGVNQLVIDDVNYGQVIKINPYNPLQQQIKNFPGYLFACAECGVDGLLYIVSTAAPTSAIVQMDTNLNILQTIPLTFVNGLSGNNFVLSITLGGDLKFYCSLSTSAGASYILQLSGTNLSVQNELLIPNTTVGGLLYLGPFGTDGNVWGVLQNGFTYLGSANTDSQVVQVSPTSFTLLNTYTLTGSVGGSPTSHPGCAGNIAPSNMNGKMYVPVGQDAEASPSVQGYAVEIG